MSPWNCSVRFPRGEGRQFVVEFVLEVDACVHNPAGSQNDSENTGLELER